MPQRAFQVCTYPGCNTLVRGGRCERHPYQKKRNTHYGNRYGGEWRKIRDAYLERHPQCEMKALCVGARATEVDHIVPLSRGGTHEPRNLQAACKRCHSHKTAHENKLGQRK